MTWETSLILSRFQRCCERAMQGALKLCAMASGYKETSIEESYRKYCADGGFGMMEDEPIQQDEIDPAEEPLEFDQEDECLNLLHCMQQETVFTDPDLDPPEVPAPSQGVDLEFERKADEDLKNLVGESNSKERFEVGISSVC